MEHIITFIIKIVINLISELKGMSLYEKMLVIILFVIPIPFTMEGYIILKTTIKNLKLKTIKE